jgi:hypothetical protein
MIPYSIPYSLQKYINASELCYSRRVIVEKKDKTLVKRLSQPLYCQASSERNQSSHPSSSIEYHALNLFHHSVYRECFKISPDFHFPFSSHSDLQQFDPRLSLTPLCTFHAAHVPDLPASPYRSKLKLKAALMILPRSPITLLFSKLPNVQIYTSSYLSTSVFTNPKCRGERAMR